MAIESAIVEWAGLCLSIATGFQLGMWVDILAVSLKLAASKVNVMRDLICEKNPYAEVSAHPVELTYENAETIKQLITQASVVICATDNRPSKLIVNRLCIEADKVALYGGAFRRAYGGQVLCVRPKRSPCDQCSRSRDARPII